MDGRKEGQRIESARVFRTTRCSSNRWSRKHGGSDDRAAATTAALCPRGEQGAIRRNLLAWRLRPNGQKRCRLLSTGGVQRLGSVANNSRRTCIIVGGWLGRFWLLGGTETGTAGQETAKGDRTASVDEGRG